MSRGLLPSRGQERARCRRFRRLASATSATAAVTEADGGGRAEETKDEAGKPPTSSAPLAEAMAEKAGIARRRRR